MLDSLQQTTHVWIARPDSIELSTLKHLYWPVLSEAEQLRSQRFHFEHDSKHYLAAHALLRLCLAHYLSISPQQLAFTTSQHGKPELTQSSQTLALPLRFNLSHTRGMVACVVSLQSACGVDVEGIRSLKEMAGVAQAMYSNHERIWLAAQPLAQQDAAFFTLWTLKEAYIKATGLGMSAPLQEISIAPQTLSVQDDSRLTVGPENWLLDCWQPSSEHMLAIACEDASKVNSVTYTEFDLLTAQQHVLRQRL